MKTLQMTPVFCLLKMEDVTGQQSSENLIVLAHNFLSGKQQEHGWRTSLAVLHPANIWEDQLTARYTFLESSGHHCALPSPPPRVEQLGPAGNSLYLHPAPSVVQWGATGTGSLWLLLAGRCQGDISHQDRDSEDCRLGQETLWATTKACRAKHSPTSPLCTHTCTQPKTWVSWKRPMVNGE